MTDGVIKYSKVEIKDGMALIRTVYKIIVIDNVDLKHEKTGHVTLSK